MTRKRRSRKGPNKFGKEREDSVRKKMVPSMFFTRLDMREKLFSHIYYQFDLGMQKRN